MLHVNITSTSRLSPCPGMLYILLHVLSHACNINPLLTSLNNLHVHFVLFPAESKCVNTSSLHFFCSVSLLLTPSTPLLFPSMCMRLGEERWWWFVCVSVGWVVKREREREGDTTYMIILLWVALSLPGSCCLYHLYPSYPVLLTEPWHFELLLAPSPAWNTT